jgi:hypothetical protein
VIFETQQAGRRTLALTEIAGGERRNAGAGGAEQKQKYAGERIAAHMKRQIR